jgi:hypothetical protein
MPRRIVIQPSVREYGAHRERYGTLVAELQTEDVLVRLVSPSGNLAQHGGARPARPADREQTVL